MLINLPDLVRAQLLERRGEWLVVSNKADVSHSWISKFVNGHIPNPGYATLQRLYTSLQCDAQEKLKPELVETQQTPAQPAIETVATQEA